MAEKITIQTQVEASVEKAWECWITPADICNWNFASDDWQCPNAQNDLVVGGKFNYRMEAKDGSSGFDFTGSYTEVIEFELIKYKMDDDRAVEIIFQHDNGLTKVIETFETENIHTAEQQRQGWQAILNNFKSHVEQK